MHQNFRTVIDADSELHVHAVGHPGRLEQRERPLRFDRCGGCRESTASRSRPTHALDRSDGESDVDADAFPRVHHEALA